MINKKIIINDIDVNALNSDEIACMNRYEVARLFVKIVERLVAKEQECEELRQYHNKCCTEFENEKQALLEKYNQVSINFYNGDYCNTEHCSLLKRKEQECEELKEEIKHYKQIAQYHGNLSVKYTNKSAKLKQTLIEIKEMIKQGVKIHDDIIVSKQILQKISECEVDNA